MIRVASILGLLFIAACTTALADVAVRGDLDRGAIAVGESAVLTITIEGGGTGGAEPSIRTPEGLRIREAGTSRSFTMVNGRVSQSLDLRYVVVGLRAGNFEIGPIDVTVSERTYRIGPYHLEVSPHSSGSGESSVREDRGSAEGTAPLWVEMTVEPREVFVGQQVTLRTRFWNRSDMRILDARLIPAGTEGFWKEELPPERRSRETRGGRIYDVSEIATALFPTRAGELTITPARVAVTYQEPLDRRRDPFSFFSRGGREREAEPSAESQTVQVLPLPAGAPVGFTGAVGSYRMSGVVDRKEAAQGEPISWTVEITGGGNIAAVEGPEFPEIPGCRGFDGGVEVASARKDDQVGGKKRFTWVLIPESAGAVDLPPFSWSYFDPDARVYKTLSASAQRIQVTPAAEGLVAAGGRVGSAIRGIREQTRLIPLDSRRPWSVASFWLWQLIPIAALAVGYMWKRRRDEMERDPEGTRLRTAPRRLRVALRGVENQTGDPWGDLTRAVESYLADQYGTQVRGMTREILQDHLIRWGNDPTIISELIAILAKADAMRYHPDREAGGSDLVEARRRVGALAARLRRRRRLRA